MNENETYEHIVEIDEYTEIKLKIPKVIDAISFNALLQKSSKLLKMSEITINTTEKRSYNKWNEENNKQLLEDYKNTPKEERYKLLEKYNFKSMNGLWQRINRTQITKVNMQKKYSNELVEKLINEVKKGREIKDIAKEFNINGKTIYHLLFNRTGKTVGKLRLEGAKQNGK